MAWLLVLLVLVLAGLGAAWFAMHESKSKTTRSLAAMAFV